MHVDEDTQLRRPSDDLKGSSACTLLRMGRTNLRKGDQKSVLGRHVLRRRINGNYSAGCHQNDQAVPGACHVQISADLRSIVI